MRKLVTVLSAGRYSIPQIILKIKKDTYIEDLLRTSGILYAGGVVALVLVVIQQFSLARILGPSDYGRLAIIISSGLLALLFLDFRTWELGIKLITSEIANEAPVEVVRIFNWLISIELVSGLFGAALIFVLAEPLAVHLLNIPGFEWMIRFYASSLPFRVVADGVATTVPRIYNDFKWVAYKTVLNNFLRLILPLALVLVGYGLSGAVVGIVISEIVNFIVVVVIAWRILKREMPGVRLWDRTRPRLRMPLYRMISDYWVVSTLTGLHYQAFIPFMGTLTSTAQVGLFRIGLDVAQLIEKLVAPFTLGVTPQIMRVHAQEEWGTFTRYIKRIAVLFFIAIAPLTAAILVLGPFIFPRILPDERYSLLPVIASILSVGNGIAMAILPWTRPALLVLDHSRIQSLGMLLQTFMMFIMLWWLTPEYGAFGAAIAMAVPMALFHLFYLAFWIYSSKRQPASKSLEAPR